MGFVAHSVVTPTFATAKGNTTGSVPVATGGVVAFTFFKIVKVLTMQGTDITVNNENLGNLAGAFLLIQS
jgi:SP family galactose:H+ symporter-like MFS transporter